MTAEKAIDLLDNLLGVIEDNHGNDYDEALKTAIKFLKVKSGTWKKENRDGVEYTAVCNKCGYSTFWSDTQYFNFCPSCGAFMNIEGKDE